MLPPGAPHHLKSSVQSRRVVTLHPVMGERDYDLVLHGATGYTGKFAASYISKSQRTNLRWAVAGRSRAKLEAVVAQLKEQFPNREGPGE